MWKLKNRTEPAGHSATVLFRIIPILIQSTAESFVGWIIHLQSPPLANGTMRPASTRFDVAFMPQGIQSRKLEQYSVHYNAGSRLFIATIVRPGRAEGVLKTIISFKFPSEREAKKFAKAYTPPKWVPATAACQICSSTYNNGRISRPCSCRNCGACICDKCSSRWGIRMIPKTYVSQQSLTVRVCTWCDWLSNAFCMTLLKGGTLQDAKSIFETGNVNLRTCFADINHEAM